MSKELKFKVGDKVLVSIPDSAAVIMSAKEYNGKVVEIIDVKEDDYCPYCIEDYEPRWPDTYFTLVEDEVEIEEIKSSEVTDILES